jgi:hypothetical protein
MKMNSEQYHVLRPVGLLALWVPLFLLADTRADEKATERFEWTIAASKAAYYPGEPVGLTITIRNASSRDESVYLGAFGVGAFSFDLRDNSGRTIAQGGRVQQEEGISGSRPMFVQVPAGQTAKTFVVLNRWCSTMVPSGEYRVICQADYKVKSEATPIPGSTKGFSLDNPHKAEMSLDVNIVKADPSKYEDILDKLQKDANRERQPGETFGDHRASQQSAGEMIAFCEWPEAVAYQLRDVKMQNVPWLTLYLIRSLGKSQSLEAAKGLMALADDPARKGFRSEIIKAIHMLHASGKADIVKTTNAFVKQYPL